MMTLDEMIAVLQAAKEGKKIECRLTYPVGEWQTVSCAAMQWNFGFREYRVKPEPREWWILDIPEREQSMTYKYEQEAHLVASELKAKVIHVREVLE